MSDSQRVDELLSRAAIAELVAEYCHGCDACDEERFAAIWHDDARLSLGPPFGEPVGEQIRDALHGIRRAFPDIRHWTTNLVLEFTSSDSARGECATLCEAIDRQGGRSLISATYHDRFERREGIWKFARREVVLNHRRPLPAS